MGKRLSFGVVLCVTLFICGCAAYKPAVSTIPVPSSLDTIETFVKISDSFSIKRSEIIEQIHKDVKDYIIDDASLNKVNEIITSKEPRQTDILRYERNLTPEEMGRMKSNIIKALSEAFYRNGNNVYLVESGIEYGVYLPGTGKVNVTKYSNGKIKALFDGSAVNVKSEIAPTSTGDSDHTIITVTFSQQWRFWNNGPNNPVIGYLKIKMDITYKYTPPDRLQIIFKVADITKQEPSFPDWFPNTGIDLSAFVNTIKEVKEASPLRGVSAESLYVTTIAAIRAEIKKELGNRFAVKPAQSLPKIEQKYKVGFDVAISRLQRKLDKFKYEKDKSTFILTESFNKFYLGKDNKYDLTAVVKLFPEENNKTFVVYDVKYQPLRDELTRQDVFGSNDAEGIRKDYIKTISQTLGSNSK